MHDNIYLPGACMAKDKVVVEADRLKLEMSNTPLLIGLFPPRSHSAPFEGREAEGLLIYTNHIIGKHDKIQKTNKTTTKLEQNYNKSITKL